jgi:hypothetical protein
VAALAAFAAEAGHMLVVDAPEHSDVILVLAGETDYRPALALDLLRRGYAPRIVIDVPAAARIYSFQQTDLARQYVGALPEAAAITICPIEGLSTRDESHDVEKCLKKGLGPVHSVLIVTSDFHTRRALSIFRHELDGRSFSTATARDAAQFGLAWWRHRQWAKTCLYEWMRLIWWKGIDRWR